MSKVRFHAGTRQKKSGRNPFSFFTGLAVLLLSLMATANGFSQSGSQKIYQKEGIALKGYDVVAYFAEQKAVMGSKEFSFDWNGVQWWFSSKEHLETFKKAPEKYMPQYGGFCAYGTSENHLSPTDPMAWRVIGDKLFLNYNTKVQSLWLQDTSGRIVKADAYWKTLLDQ